jgi:ABC-type antimicrobial peptide transport system permease subunit
MRGREPAALVNPVTPGYFTSVGTTLLTGRGFDTRDGAKATRTAIINESMAEAMFGSDNPIGRRIAPVSDGELQWVEIVGVAADVRNVLPRATVVPYQFYVPMAQETRSSNELAIRTAAGVTPNSLVPAVRDLFAQLDADLPVRDLKSADDRIYRTNYQLGVLRDMLTGFAILGLGLAAIGIYGVITRTMAQRTNEFGIRLALGAQVSDITRLVLGTGVRLALSGAVLGVVGGLGLAQLLSMGFPNMELRSPLMVVIATLGLVVIALLACYLPARRAAKINPVESLRAE